MRFKRSWIQIITKQKGSHKLPDKTVNYNFQINCKQALVLERAFFIKQFLIKLLGYFLED